MLPNALITIGGHELVYMYGIMIAVGILCAFGVLYLFGKKMSIPMSFLDFIFYDGIASILLGFGCAALVQATLNYFKEPENGFHFGGISFLPGLIGGAAVFLLGYFFFGRRQGKLSDVLSLFPCCILIAHGFGRIGCFFAGCCYGKETDFFLGVKFPGFHSPVHPTQLYEAAFLFIMFGVCSFLLLKKKFRYNLPLYIGSYGLFRFLVEFLRGDDRGKFFGPFSPSQVWSALMVVGAIAWLIYRLAVRRREKLTAGEYTPMYSKFTTSFSGDNAEDGEETEENGNTEETEPTGNTEEKEDGTEN